MVTLTTTVVSPRSAHNNLPAASLIERDKPVSGYESRPSNLYHRHFSVKTERGTGFLLLSPFSSLIWGHSKKRCGHLHHDFIFSFQQLKAG